MFQLYDLSKDFTQAEDIAAKHPEKVKEMREKFVAEAKKHQVFPLDASVAARIVAPRPNITAGRTEFVYTRPMVGLPQGDSPMLLNASYTITADIEVPQGGAEGMILTSGGRFAGYGFYLLKGKPVFLWNLVDLEAPQVGRPRRRSSPGKHTLEFDFQYEGLGAGTLAFNNFTGVGRPGTGTLKVDGKAVDTKKMEKTLPMILQWDESFDIGSDTLTGVNDADYQPPFPLTAKLDKLTIKVDRPQAVARGHQEARRRHGESRRREVSRFGRKPRGPFRSFRGGLRIQPRKESETVKRILFGAALAFAVRRHIVHGLRGGAKTPSPKPRRASSIGPASLETKAIAEEGFIYGLPLVMNYAVNYEFWVDKTSGQYKCPFNQLYNEHRVFTYQDTAVVTPNSDTPYSFAGMDLRAEPYVISVPAVEKARYYSVQLIDWNTFNFGYIGSRATGSEAGDYLVVGPTWKGATPPGIQKVFHSTTEFVIALFRTQLFGSDDMPNVVKVQEGYQLQPLSAYLHQPAPPAAPAVEWPVINQELVKKNFFEYLDFVLQFAPATPEEKAIRAKLARIGIGPGKTFDFKDLSLEHKAEIAPRHDGRRKESGGESRQRRQEDQRLDRRLGVRRSGSITTATGCCAPPPPRPASTATTRWRPCIR